MEKNIKTKNFKKIKDGWYNFILEKPLRGCEKENIQYIIEVDGNYGVASIKPLTIKDIYNINIREWNFKEFKEIIRRKI